MTNFAEVVARADEAGREAAQACNPQMMIVKGRDADGNEKVWDNGGGGYPVCGFAWVVVKPNRGAFANYLKANAGFSKHWAGGISNWVSDYEQSLDMKAAHARAYAEVLREAGLNAYSDSRMD